ncbi:GH15 family glucan-1,4-alpha-glucosidase [Sphingobacterium allocomposti]|uniref:GH15 family glucan-1,4-alpha-glucosidase n=1 Tax=Sphingobacterium allocomposti TaxID=415956 RepID=A0A5S5D8P8_9SPHI|nr:glycoside hydrolase family 15 protein [Sphingobacterium composti Yoo et al. 2007 non Ten et al. 2007]TYP92467.1 GH15 family glucan-1,4-alpha-glucosidase [Sphingobacterium composti Yoo et al. 2007 non Ten et al. 2007]HLS95915.1 glycoside hydrolase family 15 protein [Sphingobacterium sp.]
MQTTNKHTYNSGIIGNCAYIAHVEKNTNISWLCWPSFQDSFVFGGLLDKGLGGEFSILPSTPIKESNQYYLENTNILCTVIDSEEGSYRVTDFAPRFEQYERYFKPLMLIRKIEPVRGNPKIRVTCEPVLDYGQRTLEKFRGSNHIQFERSDVKMRLATNMPISHFFDDLPYVLSHPVYLVLTYGSPFEAPLQRTAEDFLSRTKSYWQKWVKNASIPPFYQREVIRSALALKLHQYEDTGAIIAASTTSLPEFPGSGRNWDYRYCWLRDSYYVLTALSHIGHFEEMEKYAAYIANITQTDSGRLQPLYGILGQHKLEEQTLDYLEGYLGNKPIRIGNQAYEHIQNDVYGQALIALLPLFTDHRFRHQNLALTKDWTTFILDKIEATIDEPDAGIWEFRNFENRHCYSNLFQWAGATAALKIAKQYGLSDIADRALRLRTKAAEHIESCYDQDRGVFTNATGSDNLDASTLQLIMMNYLDPSSQRARKHLEELEKDLKGEHGLFYRYLHRDDFGKPKATFLVCAFWYVEALACVGRLDEAQEVFKQLLSFGNHLMLFSEDVNDQDGSQWGNFPQAYSHVGLVNAAYRIAIKLDSPAFFESLYEQ